MLKAVDVGFSYVIWSLWIWFCAWRGLRCERDDGRKKQIYGASHIIDSLVEPVDGRRNKIWSLSVAIRRKLNHRYLCAVSE